MATYTFENVVINGVDTSKTYNDSTLPLRGVKRIICNGEDKLHKNVNKTIYNTASTYWSTIWVKEYITKVLDKITLGDGVKSIKYIYGDDETTIKGFIIEFEVPTTFYYAVDEHDTVVGGGWISFASDTVKNVLTVKLDFAGTGDWQEPLLIVATNTEAGVYYNKTIEATNGFDLGLSNIEFTIKGRVY